MVPFNYMMTERLNMSYASNAFNGEKCFRIVDRSIDTLFKNLEPQTGIWLSFTETIHDIKLYQYMSLGLISTYINNWILYRN